MFAFHSPAGGNAVRLNRGKHRRAEHGGGAGKGDGHVNGKLPPIEDVRLRKLVELIDAEPLGNIHDWAGALNLSDSHLQRLFKQATGLALGHLLSERRLQRAANLLTNTNLSIKEVACAVGYEHCSSFTRAFERRFAQAPRQYRMESGWEGNGTNRRAS